MQLALQRLVCLAANQQAMMNQLMAYGAATADPSRARINAAVPHNVPIAQFNIPVIGSFQPTFTARGGQRGGRVRGGRATTQGQGGRHTPRTPFADYTARAGGGGGGIPAFVPMVAPGGTPARNTTPMFSNIVKRYNNMNACFSCGFDVEDGHTSRTCPYEQYIDAGYNACTKAKHKTQLPNF